LQADLVFVSIKSGGGMFPSSGVGVMIGSELERMALVLESSEQEASGSTEMVAGHQKTEIQKANLVEWQCS
jgi:hypothetical protein